MTESGERDRSTPSEALAREIAERLIEAGLVEPDTREKLERGLARGTLSRDEWLRLVERGAGRERRQ